MQAKIKNYTICLLYKSRTRIINGKRIVEQVVYLSQRINVLKPDFGKHQAIGGKIEFGETDIDTIIREVKKETGISIRF